jgi:hypothetical protein
VKRDRRHSPDVGEDGGAGGKELAFEHVVLSQPVADTDGRGRVPPVGLADDVVDVREVGAVFERGEAGRGGMLAVVSVRGRRDVAYRSEPMTRSSSS